MQSGVTKTAYSEGASSAMPVSSQSLQIEAEPLDASTTSVASLGDTPVSDTAQITSISNESVGVNLETRPTNTAQPIQTNSLAQQSLSAFNTNAISANVEAIDVNTRAIQANRVLIDQAFAGIGENATAIQANLSSISDVEEGLAAVAALPDMFLARDESLSLIHI